MDELIKNKLPEAIQNNSELKNTIKLEDTEYNINAAVAEVAKHTQANLTINTSLADDVSTENFDGSADITINYVPSTGGKFTGNVSVAGAVEAGSMVINNDSGNSVANLADNEVVKYGQVTTIIKNLDGAPLYKWDAASKKLTAVANASEIPYKLNTVVGKTADLQALVARDTDSKNDEYLQEENENGNNIEPFPFLYICDDGDADTSLTSNKMFLKLPGEDLIEVSKGAARLERTGLLPSSNYKYYTYDTLAAVIAGINSRLTALGSKDLALPTTLTVPIGETDTSHILVPDLDTDEEEQTTLFKSIVEKNANVLVKEDTVPSVQELAAAIEGLEISQGATLDGVAGKYTSKTVGGLAAGEKLNGNITLSSLLQRILGISDGVAPSGFSFTISPNSITADLDQTSQSITATWSVLNSGTYTGSYTPTIGGKSSTATTSKSGTISGITVKFDEDDTSKSISGSATYAAGTGFDAGTLNGGSKSLTINRTCYYGPSSGTLSSTTRTSKSDWTVQTSYNINNDYFIIQYPKAWGKLSSITDNDTGYEALGSAFKSEPTIIEVKKVGDKSYYYYEYKTVNKQNGKMNFTINS